MTSSTSAQLQQNFRLINIDLLDPDSPSNFDLTTLLPPPPPPSASSSTNSTNNIHDIQQIARQQLRSGNPGAALRTVLQNAPVGGDGGNAGAKEEEDVKDTHLATVLEVLQGIRQGDIKGLLSEMMNMSDNDDGGSGGTELLDRLGKYLYKGMGMSNVMDHHQQQQQHHLHAQGGQRKVSLGMSPQSTGGYTSSSMRSAGGVGAAVDGGAGSGSGALMSVLLSWHEKLVEIAGLGCIVRVMTDRRTV